MERIIPAGGGDDGTQAGSHVRKRLQVYYAGCISCVSGHDPGIINGCDRGLDNGSEVQRLLDVLSVEHQAHLLTVRVDVHEIDLVFESFKEQGVRHGHRV